MVCIVYINSMFCQRFTNLSICEAHDEEGKAQPLVQAEMMVMEKSLGYGWKGGRCHLKWNHQRAQIVLDEGPESGKWSEQIQVGITSFPTETIIVPQETVPPSARCDLQHKAYLSSAFLLHIIRLFTGIIENGTIFFARGKSTLIQIYDNFWGDFPALKVTKIDGSPKKWRSLTWTFKGVPSLNPKKWRIDTL